MYTLSQYREAYGRYKQDISDVSASTFVDWMNYLTGFLYDKLVNTVPVKFIKTTNYSVQPGVSSYPLPADFRDVSRFSTGLFELDSSNRLISPALPQTSYASGQGGYYIEGDNIIVTPSPQSSKVFSLKYVPLPPIFTDLSDYFSTDKTINGVALVRDEDTEYIVKALDVFYTQWDEDLGLEGIVDQRFTRILSEMLGRQRQSINITKINNFTGSF